MNITLKFNYKIFTKKEIKERYGGDFNWRI